VFDSILHSARAGVSGMNPLDWVIALVLAASTIAAFIRGLIRSLVSLAGAIAGVMAACWYAPKVAAYLARWIRTPALAEIVAFVLILAAVWLIAALIGRLLRGACTAVGLGFLDRLAGAAFGFARAVLLLAAILLPLGPYLPHFEEARGSILLPYLLPATHGISFVMPRDFGKHISDGEWLNPAKIVSTGIVRP
jgi:membrane protein required for colicin V production